jgi:hypothetical protein
MNETANFKVGDIVCYISDQLSASEPIKGEYGIIVALGSAPSLYLYGVFFSSTKRVLFYTRSELGRPQ